MGGSTALSTFPEAAGARQFSGGGDQGLLVATCGLNNFAEMTLRVYVGLVKCHEQHMALCRWAILLKRV